MKENNPGVECSRWTSSKLSKEIKTNRAGSVLQMFFSTKSWKLGGKSQASVLVPILPYAVITTRAQYGRGKFATLNG